MHENDHRSDILLRASDEEGILRLTLNDVARRNALSEAMLRELGGAIVEAGADPSTRLIVLAAHGPAFSAGHHGGARGSSQRPFGRCEGRRAGPMGGARCSRPSEARRWLSAPTPRPRR